ncbi:hypothetical protein [Treponema pedis]|uniref:Lipocalin-like domain-containing protein n=1 Tax=Treponema pedis str. T A4 TaxID=1291379 RepID=S5ZT68_9SPIR|nr:hypothetical protein [Treponema pedis]AGT43315.1 hypothetical protein TPE_0819 [Treponema pedis str. T A4]
MKEKRTNLIVGVSVLIACIIVLASSCSLKQRISGVWEVKNQVKYINGKQKGEPTIFPQKVGDVTMHTYYCFTGSGVFYNAENIVGGNNPGLYRGAGESFTADGNRLIISGENEQAIEIKGNKATATIEIVNTSTNPPTVTRTVISLEKVKSPSVKDIQNAKRKK